MPQRKQIKPGKKVGLTLTAAERLVILNDLIAVDQEHLQTIQDTPLGKPVYFTALALRQRDAVPVWERFGVWLASEKVQRALPQSRFGQAVGYLQNQWTSPQRYLADGRIPIDNNQSEQIIRPLTTGRKNWCAPDVPSRTSGRSKARDALLAMFERTVAVRSATCI